MKAYINKFFFLIKWFTSNPVFPQKHQRPPLAIIPTLGMKKENTEANEIILKLFNQVKNTFHIILKYFHIGLCMRNK